MVHPKRTKSANSLSSVSNGPVAGIDGGDESDDWVD